MEGVRILRLCSCPQKWEHFDLKCTGAGNPTNAQQSLYEVETSFPGVVGNGEEGAQLELNGELTKLFKKWS